jgi:hypothetical protein
MDLELDAVREELSGLWDWTRAQFWMTAAQSAARDDDWPTAASRLLRLAGPLGSRPSGTAAWKQLARTTIDATIRAGDPSLVQTAANRLLDEAWPTGTTPHELVGSLRLADELDASAEGEKLGEILERRYPKFGWGPYAAAHFAERRAVAAGRSLDDPETTLGRFELAAKLFDGAHLPGAARHCRLRCAVLRMTATPQTDAARAALKQMSTDEFDTDERHWFALAQANSPFWLDRVRAADYVGDTFDRVGTDTPEGRAVAAIAEVLFTRLPVHLAGAEVDRLRDLAEEFEGDARWELEAQLRGREAVEERSSAALDEVSTDAAKELEEHALPLDGFTAIVSAWSGDSAEAPGRPEDAVAARVVDALVAMQGDDAERVASSLTALVDVSADAEASRLRPLALVFPRAFEWNGEGDAIADSVTRLATLFARRAPRPSYGFLNLAAALFDAGLWKAGTGVTRRALDEGERTDEKRLDAAVARSVQWAVREGSDREMLEWLEIGEQRFA